MKTTKHFPHRLPVDAGAPMRPDLPAETLLLRRLRAAARACRRLLAAHGAGCSRAGCLFCADVEPILWQLELAESVLSSQLLEDTGADPADGPVPDAVTGSG